jgi:hypothetical protein
MAEIDVGDGATNRANFYIGTQTIVDNNNPANDTGVLDTVEIYINADGLGTFDHYVGTFSGSGKSWTNRDYANVGAISSGEGLKTFTGLSIDVVTNDTMGWYCNDKTCKIEADSIGGGDCYYLLGNQFGAGTKTYTELTDAILSIYATGETVAVGSNFIYGVFKSPIFHSTIFRS